MTNTIESGKVFNYTCTGTVNSGDFILIGVGLFGCAVTSGISGQVIAVNLCGVYQLVKATGTGAIAIGDALYWDNTAKKVTNVTTSNTLIGYAWTAQATGDTTIQVRLLYV